ncbi:hypothetical protein B0H16DRAFT_1884878 [Mycena metata]|uniref:Uncharacterized protein n=1 Tax=Mycena metata TaxID=1033252 RepID=A0AAD7NGP8_9AGAR|nr:hypothetical protein B0H16DRAFT_1884878 [Mycena metata]
MLQGRGSAHGTHRPRDRQTDKDKALHGSRIRPPVTDARARACPYTPTFVCAEIAPDTLHAARSLAQSNHSKRPPHARKIRAGAYPATPEAPSTTPAFRPFSIPPSTKRTARIRTRTHFDFETAARHAARWPARLNTAPPPPARHGLLLRVHRAPILPPLVFAESGSGVALLPSLPPSPPPLLRSRS